MSILKKLKGSIVSIVVICIIMLIIVPVPSQILDFLLITNLSLALVILFITMYITDALDFSIFPSLLLITTIFDLALEISATRLILTHNGNAGEVIHTFGTFVIPGGNVLVGIVIFLIIIIVQFLVITKGSERVAEVAARFNLDAMPGKQMAIDADLNNGLINEQQASERRQKIQRAADFFGSMDGASKFVKGNSIVAIIIMIINIVGGIVSGAMSGGDLTVVMRTYTIATIGEGLMSQLPALLISTATGIIVTRSASKDDMNTELTSQLFSRANVMGTTGAVLLFMVFIPGFPKIILLILGGLYVFLAITLGKSSKQKAKRAKVPVKKAVENSEFERLKNPENIYSMMEVEPISMEFGYSLLQLADETQGGTFVDKVVLFRRQFALETGLVIPSVCMRDNIQIPNNRYIIKIRGEEVAQGSILVGSLLIMNPNGDDFAIDGIDTVEPAFGLKARWISTEKREEAEMDGYTVVEPAAVMMTHLSEVIRRHAHEILGRRETNALLDLLKKSNKSLVDELIPSKISVGTLEKVLQSLLRESIPIRDMETILETISDHTPRVKDPDMLTEFVRQSLRRTISHKIAPDGDLKVLTISPQVEKEITQSVRQTDTGTYLAMEPAAAQNILSSLSEKVGKCGEAGIMPVVLVSPVVRMYFKRLTEQSLPDVVVVSYNEIENDVKIHSVGAIAA